MLVANDQNFNQVLAAPRAIVDFWSPACGYCMKFKPTFEEVDSELGSQYLFAAVNVDEAPASAAQFGVQALPTIVFLENGREVNRIEGAVSKGEFLAAIQQSFGGSVTPSGAPSLMPHVLGGLALLGLGGLVYWAATRKA